MDKHISVIIPTYNERDNLEPLVKEIHRAMAGEDYEIVFIDDNSRDGTAELAESLAKMYPVRVIVRRDERGLASAVVHGFNQAKSDILAVMDADLQHPPMVLKDMVQAARDGADLVIACVGAGLRAFTRFAQVEYANGEPVPADLFLTEVEGAVLEALLEKLFGVSQAGVGSVDPVTRFYVLWRYAYRHATLDAGEAIVFAYPQRVELDGPGGLTSGVNPLLEKRKGKYRLRDFTERGEDEDLGLPRGGEIPPLMDVLHRLLWLEEHRPALIPAYLDEAQPDVERLRLVAQTLAGQTLAGNSNGGGRSLVAARGAEASALRKLTTNWRTLIEAHRGPMV